MKPEPFIVYDPPYGGQAIRPTKPVPAWERAAAFLRGCIDADPDQPDSVELTLYEPSHGDPAEWYEQAVQAAEHRFGRGERRAWLQDIQKDQSLRSRRYCVDWRLPSQRCIEARSYLTEHSPWPRTKDGPVALTLSYRFRWVDPRSRAVLPGQVAEARAHPSQATSHLLLFLAERSSAILEARFPFAAADDAFAAYVGFVAPFAPVPLLPNRFRHWIPTKQPSDLGYKMRKVDGRLLDKLRAE
jgi:hypothetical protein